MVHSNTKKKTPTAPQFAHAAQAALQKNDYYKAVELYALATQKAPQNLDYKIRLINILRYINFNAPNPAYQRLVYDCLNTTGLAHQNLAKPWFSLLMCDPLFKPLHDVITRRTDPTDDVIACLEHDFLLAGLNKLTVLDMGFETALGTLHSYVRDRGIDVPRFLSSYERYCINCEYVCCEEPTGQDLYAIDSSIPSLGLSDCSISQKVRTLYEENPYPRWTSIDIPPTTTADTIRKYDHLIAGCGTGYGACGTALRNPGARITAIDLSLTSLSYAKAKATELGLRNIQFYQADILNLGQLDGQFDVIECAGVLHHMDDPLKGWQCLLQKLKPNGRMHIGLYSELGRADIIAARDVIAVDKSNVTHKDIYQARKKVANLPKDHPARSVLKRRDFYSTSSCRDLLFHVKEHRFSIPQISKMLNQLGLEFDGFDICAPIIEQTYRARFTDDPKMTNLANWAIFEQDHPGTFRGMYQFWCRPTQTS